MQVEPTRGTVALHDQIADDLRSRIASGELAPGDPVPSARVLQEQWECSDGPVREALSILRSEGRIQTKRGGAARVRVPPTRATRTISINAEDAQQQKDLARESEKKRASQGASELTLGIPLDHTQFTAQYSQIDAGSELAEEFEISATDKVLVRTYRTVRTEDGLLALSSVSYVPVALIERNPRLLDEKEEPWPGGHWNQLYTVGIEIDRLEHVITSAQPTPRQRQDWGMEHGVPLLAVRTKSIDTSDRVVELSDAFYPADRIAISYTSQLKRW